MSHDTASIASIVDGILNDSEMNPPPGYDSPDSCPDRDTLFVSSPGTSSELIVTYNSGKLRENSKASVNQPSSESLGSDAGPSSVVNIGQIADAFTLSRVILSGLLGRTGETYLRTCMSLFDRQMVCSLVNGIMLASNIQSFLMSVVCKSDSSSDATLLIYPSTRSEAKLTPLHFSRNMDSGTLVVDIFHTVFTRGEAAEFIIGHDMEPLLRIVGIICGESMDTLPLLSMLIEPAHPTHSSSGKFKGSIRVVLSKLDSRTSSQLAKALHADEAETCCNEPFDISVHVPGEHCDNSSVSANVLRLFMGGYPSVAILSGVRCRAFWEVILIVAKYFELSFSLSKDSTITVSRKCTTIDPAVVVRETPSSEIQQFTETSSLLAIGSHILSSLSKGEVKVSLVRSIPLTTGLASVLVQACQNAQFTVRSDGDNRILCSVKPESKMDTNQVSDILNLLTTSGDVSPSNYRPVDASIRHGTEEELSLVRSKLESLSASDKQRFSLLLVGPWNIGAGVRVIAEESNKKHVPLYEFIAERAVRDSAGVTLKCAARIFVCRDDFRDAKISFARMLTSSAVVKVAESDSRITVANKLFTHLNEAPSANPYVLIRAQGDYCTFIAAMSVVVANGWSRSIHQRVETRVTMTDDETVFYIARLILNN